MWFRLGFEPEENCGGPTLPACHFEANEGAYLPNLDETFSYQNDWTTKMWWAVHPFHSAIAFACLIYIPVLCVTQYLIWTKVWKHQFSKIAPRITLIILTSFSPAWVPATTAAAEFWRHMLAGDDSSIVIISPGGCCWSWGPSKTYAVSKITIISWAICSNVLELCHDV